MCLDLLEKYGACQRLTVATLSRTYTPASSRFAEADKRQARWSAPNLQELTLAYDWPRAEGVGNQNRRRPIPFSLGELPRLSNLTASRAPYSDIRTFFRPTITRLSLLHLFERIPTDQFFAALKSMPLLEVLELHTALSPFDGRHILPHHFQHLRRLSLADGMANLADYLTSLVFRTASLESIEISCEPPQYHTQQDGPMLPHRLRSIVGRLRGLLREPIHSMYIHNKESHNSPLEIAGWSTPTVPSSLIPPHFQLKIAERNGLDILELVVVALGGIEVESVRSLAFGHLDVPNDPLRRLGIPPPSPSFLEEHGRVYSRFTRVKTMTVKMDLILRLRDSMMVKYPLDWQEIRKRLGHWYEDLDFPETRVPSEQYKNRSFLFPALRTIIVQWQAAPSRDKKKTMEFLREQFAECCALRGKEIELRGDVLPPRNSCIFLE